VVGRCLSGIFLLLSALYVYFASDMNFGVLAKPKAGFLPNLVGYLALFLCAFDCCFSWRRKLEPGEGVIEKSTVLNILLVLVVTFIYIYLLGKIGYLTATMAYLFFLFKVTRTKGFVLPVALAIAVVGAFYFCFSALLGISLP
jgi:hypothetical protein